MSAAAVTPAAGTSAALPWRRSGGRPAVTLRLARPALRSSVLAFGVSRALVWAAAVASATLAPRATKASNPLSLTHPFGHGGADKLLTPLARWDAVHLLEIARDGYGQSLHRDPFFPLYPLVVRAAAGWSRSPRLLLVSATVVSLASFLAALYLLHRLVELELDGRVASLTVWLVALWPGSLFFGAPYSESLFLLLSVAAFYAARRGAFAWAAVLCGLASATRSVGVLLAIPLALLWLRSSPRRGRSVCWLALAPAGLIGYSIYLQLSQGNWAGWLRGERIWRRRLTNPLASVERAYRSAYRGFERLAAGTTPKHAYFASQEILLFLLLVLVVLALIGSWRALRPPYAIWTTLSVALPVCSPSKLQPLLSLPRFVAVVFPLFMWAALRGRARPWLLRVGVSASTLALAVLAWLFATWHWVA